jgi:hypothetical protein
MSDDSSKPDDDYRGGYRHPPLGTRFRPGTSGNPRGRPKGARKLATVLAAALAERVVVAENGGRKRITKLEAAVKQLVNRAASGEARSMRLLLALIQASEAKPLQTESSAPSADDALVLREITRRLKGEAS